MFLFSLDGFTESNYKVTIVNTIGEDTAIVQNPQNNLIAIDNTVARLPEIFRNSVGKVTFHFEPYQIGMFDLTGNLKDTYQNSNKSCNGFLIKKSERIYLITVGHLSFIHEGYEFNCKDLKGDNFVCRQMEQRNTPKAAMLEITNLDVINLNITKNVNFFIGDDLPTIMQKAQGKETLDISCLDITDKIDPKFISNLIPYELLADIKDKNAIDESEEGITLCGYPGKYISNGYQPDKYQERLCNLLPPRDFGTIINLSKGEIPSGFYFDAQLENGDCGRPIIKKLDSKYLLLGLFKTTIPLQNNYSLSFAIDSTAIKRVIDWAYEHKPVDKN